MMYSITGQLLIAASEQTTDKESGEVRTRRFIQLLGNVPTRDGHGAKYGMVELTVQDLEPYQALKGQEIRVPFGFFAAAKGQAVQFVPKGAKPEPVTAS
jgi:hypothetical protein